MKNWIVSAFVLVAMVLALTFSTAVPTSLAASPAPPHPEIRAAIDSLQRARTHLQEAKHDFGGHRADALKSVDEAIHQLQICLQYDN